MLEIKNLCKSYDKDGVLKDVNLAINDNEFIVILGESGCGKTTLLNLIAGLIEPTSGDIIVDNKSILNKSPKERNISMVFQSYALFPDMNVYNNIAFGLQIRRVNKKEIERIVHEVAAKLKIEDLLSKKPDKLSGGERQRVAIARAIVKNPKIYLFDEPLSNLDTNLKDSSMALIKKLHEENKGIFIYVTHSDIEAMRLADRIVIMNEGKVLQIGTKEELYKRPNNIFVAKFLGEPKINLINLNNGYTLGFRPDDVETKYSDSYKLSGRIIKKDFMGASYLYRVVINNKEIELSLKLDLELTDFLINIRKDALLLFDENGNRVEYNIENECLEELI